VNARELLVVLAAGALFLVMAVSFLANVNWPTSPTSIPVYEPNATSNNGIANQMFEGFAITIILIGILLGSAMIGGVYLAKMDEPGKVGP
jgi:NADH:ubiquinone oxidoreductase subunit 6 (subunit J)